MSVVIPVSAIDTRLAERLASDRALVNTMLVGAGYTDFTDVQDAVDAIASAGDHAEANPYVIQLRPGAHGPFDLSAVSDVTVRGAGRSTIIETTGGAGNWIKPEGLRHTIENARVVHSDAAVGFIQGAIRTIGGTCEELVLRDLFIEVTVSSGDRTAGDLLQFGVLLQSGSGDWALRCSNVVIDTNCCGILVPPGQSDIYGINVWLRGEASPVHDLDQYGLVGNLGSRVRVQGGRITCGYNVQNPSRTNGSVICVYNPGVGDNASSPPTPAGWPFKVGKASADGAIIEGIDESGNRLFLHDLEMFARNEAASVGVTRCLLAENGWVRMFGGNLQTEIPNDASEEPVAIETWFGTTDQDASGRGGLVEIEGGRHSGFKGGVSSIGNRAPLVLTADFNGEKFYGGVVVADTSGGGFTFNLPNGGGATTFTNVGQVIEFTVVGGSNLTVSPASENINGSGSDVTVASGAQLRLLKYAPGEWITI